FEESEAWIPAHGEGVAPIEHPGPVDTLVNLLREGANAPVGEVGARGEDAAKQQRCVNGRQFAVTPAPAGFNVSEMEEEALHLWHTVEVPRKGGEDAL